MPNQNPPDEQAKIQAMREADVRRAAELGQKRAAEEKALKERLKAEAEQRSVQAHAGVDAEVVKTLEKKKGVKTYRKQIKDRAKELEADRQRREQEKKRVEEVHQAAETKRKKEQDYMKELHKTAEMKKEAEDLARLHKMQQQKARAEAQAKAQAKYDEIDRDAYNRRQACERDAVARKGVADAEYKTKVYQLESWKRMKVGEVDTQLKTGALKKDADTQRYSPENLLKSKHKAIDLEFDKKKSVLDQDLQAQKKLLETQMRSQQAAIDADARTKRHEVELKLRSELEEIGRMR